MSAAKKIAITIGDPAGLGPEIIESWVSAHPELLQFAEVIAHESFLRTLPCEISKRKVGDKNFTALAGHPTKEGAEIAYKALKVAALGCDEGKYLAVVTCPVSKEKMRAVNFNFDGQTEFFAHAWGGVPVMAFAGQKLIVSLVTWHNALCDVPKLICAQKISDAVSAANNLAKALKKISFPRIAVCGLNPHAGEGGILGMEEIETINPILEKLRQTYPNLSLALPPDTVFMRALRGEFDCIVSMYHDQALAPLKAIEFDSAVNVTMNLPHLRVSPDHGTGFDIAGKGIASPKSFECAFNLALNFRDLRNS